MKKDEERALRKPQSQPRPGREAEMRPRPVYDRPEQKGSERLKNKIAFITGGDSGIGRAVCVLFAKEGADIIVSYLNEDEDAQTVKKAVENYGQRCLLIKGDISKEGFCVKAVKRAIKEFGKIDILVNNAGIHYESKTLEDISTQQLIKTFSTNVYPLFWFTKAALPFMAKGSSIINTASVTAYRGSKNLVDYAATKGAIVSFTRSLASNLIAKGIRVNAVAPGPIWTPLIVSSLEPKKVAQHGSQSPMERAGEPVEVAPAYLFLASEDASYISGQVIHPNGGEIVNG